MKYVAEIPARFGSKRVKNKNLKLLNGKPMISYAIEAAKKSSLIDEVYVNSEHDDIGNIGIDLGVNFYKRNKNLADDETSSDEFNYDFLKNIECDILVMINPVSPLILSEDSIFIDTEFLNPQQVLKKALYYIKKNK